MCLLTLAISPIFTAYGQTPDVASEIEPFLGRWVYNYQDEDGIAKEILVVEYDDDDITVRATSQVKSVNGKETVTYSDGENCHINNGKLSFYFYDLDILRGDYSVGLPRTYISECFYTARRIGNALQLTKCVTNYSYSACIGSELLELSNKSTEDEEQFTFYREEDNW